MAAVTPDPKLIEFVARAIALRISGAEGGWRSCTDFAEQILAAINDSGEWWVALAEATGSAKQQAETAAFRVLSEHGIDVSGPWEGDLDDLERDHYDGFVAAIAAYQDAMRTAYLSRTEETK